MAGRPAGRRYAGVAEPERRGERRARLVEAALDVVGEAGVAAVTVGATCARAGLSKRYFYESFDSLDALLRSALDGVLGRVVVALGEAEPGAQASPEVVIGHLAGQVLDAVADPRVARLFLESAASTGLLEARDQAVGALAEGLLARFVGGGSVGAEVRLVAQVLIAGSAQAVAAWLRGDVDLDRAAFTAVLAGLGARTVAELQARAS